MNKELRDVLAAVLDENRLRSPRVQANAVLAAIEGRPRRQAPVAAVGCRCAELAGSAETSVQSQVIDVAEAEGRLRVFAAWLLEAYVSGRRTE